MSGVVSRFDEVETPIQLGPVSAKQELSQKLSAEIEPKRRKLVGLNDDISAQERKVQVVAGGVLAEVKKQAAVIIERAKTELAEAKTIKGSVEATQKNLKLK